MARQSGKCSCQSDTSTVCSKRVRACKCRNAGLKHLHAKSEPLLITWILFNCHIANNTQLTSKTRACKWISPLAMHNHCPACLSAQANNETAPSIHAKIVNPPGDARDTHCQLET
eukprot:1157222-Pelagomonas_calceolata.AAC.18